VEKICSRDTVADRPARQLDTVIRVEKTTTQKAPFPIIRIGSSNHFGPTPLISKRMINLARK